MVVAYYQGVTVRKERYHLLLIRERLLLVPEFEHDGTFVGLDLDSVLVSISSVAWHEWMLLRPLLHKISPARRDIIRAKAANFVLWNGLRLHDLESAIEVFSNRKEASVVSKLVAVVGS